jgi:hypothetical protein
MLGAEKVAEPNLLTPPRPPTDPTWIPESLVYIYAVFGYRYREVTYLELYPIIPVFDEKGVNPPSN